MKQKSDQFHHKPRSNLKSAETISQALYFKGRIVFNKCKSETSFVKSLDVKYKAISVPWQKQKRDPFHFRANRREKEEMDNERRSLILPHFQTPGEEQFHQMDGVIER